MENAVLMGRRPHQFFALREFRLVWGVYYTTYAAANVVETTCKKREMNPAFPVFLATTAANMTTCIYKDKEFTRMFGTVAAKPVPIPTYALFAIRDSLTIFASFTMVPYLADYFKKKNYR